MKTYGEVEVKFHTFLISSLNAGSRQLYVPAALFPGKDHQVQFE
jgi:hypothetical protein